MAYQNNPYILQAQEDQQLQGIQPMMQNIAQQQATQQMALQQQLANNQAAGQMPNQGAGASNLAMAMALRKGDKKPGLGETTNDAGKVIADPTYGNGGKYGQMTKEELANMMANGV